MFAYTGANQQKQHTIVCISTDFELQIPVHPRNHSIQLDESPFLSIWRGQNVVFAQQEQPLQVHVRCYGTHCAAGTQMAPGCLIFVCNRESDSKPKDEYIVDERYQVQEKKTGKILFT